MRRAGPAQGGRGDGKDAEKAAERAAHAICKGADVRLKEAIAHLARADARLGAVIRSVGGYSISSGGEPFQSLVGAIMYQQLAGSAADAIHGRFIKIYRGKFPTPARLLRTPAEKLRGAGLSGRKTEYIYDLALRVHGGSIDLAALASMADAQVVEKLTQVKGIGRWTAEMFLIFCLGRPDVLPVGDLGLRRAMQKVYRLRALPEPEKMEKIAEPWRPYRSVAAWYLWKSLDSFKTIG